MKIGHLPDTETPNTSWELMFKAQRLSILLASVVFKFNDYFGLILF